MHGEHLGLLALLASVAIACGRAAPEPPVAWYAQIAPACTEAKRLNRPLLFINAASWDMMTKELDRVTFEDPRVRRELRERWVALRVDRSDVYMAEGAGSAQEREVDEAQRRFKPFVSKYATVVMMAPDCTTELARIDRYEPPPVVLERLASARSRLHE